MAIQAHAPENKTIATDSSLLDETYVSPNWFCYPPQVNQGNFPPFYYQPPVYYPQPVSSVPIDAMTNYYQTVPATIGNITSTTTESSDTPPTSNEHAELLLSLSEDSNIVDN